MSSRAPAPPWSVLGALGFLILAGAGLVVSVSAFSMFGVDPFPRDVVVIAWVVFVVASVALVVSTFYGARTTGVGFFSALGRTIQTLARFLFWFLN